MSSARPSDSNLDREVYDYNAARKMAKDTAKDILLYYDKSRTLIGITALSAALVFAVGAYFAYRATADTESKLAEQSKRTNEANHRLSALQVDVSKAEDVLAGDFADLRRDLDEATRKLTAIESAHAAIASTNPSGAVRQLAASLSTLSTEVKTLTSRLDSIAERVAKLETPKPKEEIPPAPETQAVPTATVPTVPKTATPAATPAPTPPQVGTGT